MSLFYSKQQNSFSEQAIAGSFTGPDVRHLYSDEVAGDLREELNNIEDEDNLGDDVFHFLKAVEAVWASVVARSSIQSTSRSLLSLRDV